MIQIDARSIRAVQTMEPVYIHRLTIVVIRILNVMIRTNAQLIIAVMQLQHATTFQLKVSIFVLHHTFFF